MKAFGICTCGKTWRVVMPDTELAKAMASGHVEAACGRCFREVFSTATDRWLCDGLHHLLPVMN